MDCNNEKAIGALRAQSPLSDRAKRSVHEKRMPIKKRAWNLDARACNDNDNGIIGKGEERDLPAPENVATRCPRCDFVIPLKRSRCSGSSNFSNDECEALSKGHDSKTVVPADASFAKDKEDKKQEGTGIFKEYVDDGNDSNESEKEVTAVEHNVEQLEVGKQKPLNEYTGVRNSDFEKVKDEKKPEGSDIFKESFFKGNDLKKNGDEVKDVEHSAEQSKIMTKADSNHIEVPNSDIEEDNEAKIQEGSDTSKEDFADENDVKKNGKEVTAVEHDAERLEVDGKKVPKIECIEVPDSGFYEFDKDRRADCFVNDHLWAVYDNPDGMPRLYALIRKVFAPGFNVRITWLEAYSDDNYEMDWVGEDLPVSCGKFRHGESEITENITMFSHSVIYEKGANRGSLLIYPRKGETWALFRNRGNKWKSDPENYRNYEVDVVEILSDYDEGFGVSVAYLEKVEGYVSLFMQKVGVASIQIPPNELYKFSHMVPSYRTTGKERDGVPDGSLELDPASLPANLVEDIGARSTASQRRTHSAFIFRKQHRAGNRFGNISRTKINLHREWNQPLLDRQTFWTACPFCKMKHQYYQGVLNRVLQCQNCMHPFIAYGLNFQDPAALPANLVEDTKERSTTPQQRKSRYSIQKQHGVGNGSGNISRRQFRGVNLHREQRQQRGNQSTFWTACPFCNVRYQYLRDILHRPVHCQNCMKHYIAYNLDV